MTTQNEQNFASLLIAGSELTKPVNVDRADQLGHLSLARQHYQASLDKWIYLSTYGSIHQAMVSNESSGAIAGGCEERTNESKTNNVHFKTTIAPNVLLGPAKIQQ